MAGDVPDDVVRGLAKQLMPGLSGTAKPTAQVSDSQLRDFAAGTIDLATEAKQQLAIYMFSGQGIYDPETDLMDSAYSAEPVSIGRLSEPYRHPSPTVAAAWDKYQAELQAYNGPPPARPRPSPHAEPAGPKPRPGWKS
jgi:hypothetical protein